jgi:hypothetical protein
MSGNRPRRRTEKNVPAWKRTNLDKHFRVRLEKDAECLEDLMGLPRARITRWHYKHLSNNVYSKAWAVFEAQKWDPLKLDYHQAVVYFVDNDLTVAITDLPSEWFITCYHQHFNSPHGVVPGLASAGQRQLFYVQRLEDDEAMKKYINVRRRHGFV